MNATSSRKPPVVRNSPAGKAVPRHGAAETRKQRVDGAEARARLLTTALRLFAEHGFARTSTREIAQAAADVREFVAATYEALQPIVRGMCQVVEALAEWVGEFDETYPGLLDAYREEQGE